MITRKLEGSAIRDIDKRLKHVRLQPSKYDDIGGIEYVVFRKSPKFRTSNSRKRIPVKPIAVLTVDPEGVVTELKIKDFPNRSNEDIYRTLAIAVKYDLVIDENTSVVLWKNGKQTGTVNIFPDSVADNNA